MPVAVCPDRMFPCQLAQAVQIDRPGSVLLGPWRAPASIKGEDIIGAKVDEESAEITADQGDFANGKSINGEGRLRLRLGTIDEVIRSAVDHHIWQQCRQGGPNCVPSREIEIGAGQGDSFATQSWAQVAPELSRGPENGDLHGGSLRCRSRRRAKIAADLPPTMR